MAPVREEDLVRFKNAFLGTIADRETPLLAHRIPIPDSVSGNQAILDLLGSLDDEMDTSIQDANGKRTGKKIAGTSWTKNKTSSLKKTMDAIGDTVDLDKLSQITGGKGKDSAQAALAKAKDIELKVQAAIVDELTKQAKAAKKLEDQAERVKETIDFVQKPGIAVDGGKYLAVEGVARVLAKKLGVEFDDLMSASADEIKAAYLDNVYAPLKMETKAARDPGVLKTIQDLVIKLGAFDATTLTPGGEAAVFLIELQKADLANTIKMNTARAGKFAVGEPADTDLPLGDDMKSPDCKLKIKGNQRFVDAIDNAMGKIDGTDAGKALLAAIAGTKKDVEIVAPSVSSAQRVSPDGKMMYSNSADKGRVALDPDNDVAGEDATDEKVDSEKWRKRDASVALYHEMIHALIGNKGGEEWVSRNDKTLKLKISQVGDITELRIVGIDYKTQIEGKEAYFPFSDPHYNPISENNYRLALAKKNGEKVAYLRPYYANVAGQVKLSADPVNV